MHTAELAIKEMGTSKLDLVHEGLERLEWYRVHTLIFLAWPSLRGSARETWIFPTWMEE